MSPRGRPRAFDRERALTAAMFVFWERGYEGASLAELTGAMGINPPSLYAAFGGKEALFHEAVEHYGATYGGFTARALAEAPTAREAIKAMLYDNARVYTDHEHPWGCLVVLGATNCSPANQPVREYLGALRDDARDHIRKRLRRAVETGELPATTDVDALGGYYSTVLLGLSSQARDGATLPELAAVIDLALQCWPRNDAGAVSTSDTAPVES